jgi:hypothetical protein
MKIKLVDEKGFSKNMVIESIVRYINYPLVSGGELYFEFRKKGKISIYKQINK